MVRSAVRHRRRLSLPLRYPRRDDRHRGRRATRSLTHNVPAAMMHSHAGRRGRSSITLQDQPMIVMDGVELNDFTPLAVVPASDIEQIEVLTGIDATTYYGTGATKGVIRITTKGAGS